MRIALFANRKQLFITLIGLGCLLVGVGLYRYIKGNQIKADANQASTTGYYGFIKWTDGTPARGTVISMANHEATVKTDGSYYNYLSSQDFADGTEVADVGAELRFYNPVTYAEYGEAGAMEPSTLPQPTTPGTTYTAYNFVLEKPSNLAANNFHLVSASSPNRSTFAFSFRSVNPSRVTITIKNATGQTVKTLTQDFTDVDAVYDAQGTVARDLVWDETDESAQLVPNGTYTATVTASDYMNPDTTLTPISIPITNHQANNFTLVGRPTPAATGHTVTFTFSFMNPTDITIKVQRGTWWDMVPIQGTQNPGTAVPIIWNGKDRTGRSMPAGTYTATITGNDGVHPIVTLPRVTFSLN